MYTACTISCTRLHVALGKRQYQRQDAKESRPALKNGMRQRDSKSVLHCLLRDDKKRRRMETERPENDKQRMGKSRKTKVRKRKRHHAQPAREGVCLLFSVSVCRCSLGEPA